MVKSDSKLNSDDQFLRWTLSGAAARGITPMTNGAESMAVKRQQQLSPLQSYDSDPRPSDAVMDC